MFVVLYLKKILFSCGTLQFWAQKFKCMQYLTMNQCVTSNISFANPVRTVRNVHVHRIWQTQAFLTRVWGAVMKHIMPDHSALLNL